MADGPARPRLEFPTPLLSLILLVLTILLFLVLPVANDLGRGFLALVSGLALILLLGFLVPQVGRFVNRGSLLVNTGASFFFGLVSVIFLTLGNIFPWVAVWLVLCLLWTFLPDPSFHRSVEDNFGDLFN